MQVAHISIASGSPKPGQVIHLGMGRGLRRRRRRRGEEERRSEEKCSGDTGHLYDV